ncbi:MAG TPA: FGGY family carbohydrate kinase [Candidatus Limnocylindrales bacterium]|nr:FGGY family carbohydrate kinase [Candidatus Limnocylindrales bacterium]
MVVFVGCDLGTMGTKAAVVDLDGRVLGTAFEEVQIRTPRPGVVEQDLGEIEASAHRTIRRAMELAGDPQEVGGVAFSGQMSGIGGVDEALQPATHFDSWLDARCEPYINALTPHREHITRLSGCPPTYSHGPKLVWWHQERASDLRRVARFLVPGAYVAARLAGLRADEAFIDRTYLHFSNLAETERRRWSDELVALLEVDRERLPRIVDPFDVVGEVTGEASRSTGLPAGTPIAAGAGDQAAAALGAAVVDPGEAFDSAGTASVFAICADRFAPDTTQYTFMATHSVLPGLYINLSFINGGGLALRWFRDAVVGWTDREDAYEALDALAAAAEPGSGGLLWLPHFQGRVLPPDPSARAGWLGLSAGHSLGTMFRSILEGIALEYAVWAKRIASATGSAPTHARVLGGGARSRLWNQIKADTLGIDWQPVGRQEAGVLGDALIAAVATGWIDRGDVAAGARRWQFLEPAVHADPERHDRYAAQLDRYERLADRLASGNGSGAHGR